MTFDQNQLSALTTKTSEIVRKAANFIATEAQTFDYGKVEYKGLNDLVSYVDRQTEVILVEGLRQILPQAGFMTEEGTVAQAAENELLPYWIIDPLDGTTNFTHGLPPYAVSVALYQNGELLVGVVHEVTKDEQFSAYKGGGAYLNGKQIKLPDTMSIAHSLMATGFPYSNFSGLNKYLSILGELMEKCHGLRRMGSASVDLAYVASGRFQGFFEYNLNAWDVAAGILILREAGGLVTDFSGADNALFGKQIIAAVPGVQQELLSIINKHWYPAN